MQPQEITAFKLLLVVAAAAAELLLSGFALLLTMGS